MSHLQRLFSTKKICLVATLALIASSLALFPAPARTAVTAVEPEVNTMPSYLQSVTYANALANQAIAVWGNVRGDNAVGGAYSLDFGDGTAPLTGTVADIDYIGADHTYTTVGLKTMSLIVTDTRGITDTSESLIRVFPTPATREVEINMAIEKGLLYLYNTQDAAGWWQDTLYYGIGATGLAVLAFEENGHLPTNNTQEDIYAEAVMDGLTWLLTAHEVVDTITAHDDGTGIQYTYVQSATMAGPGVGASFWAQNSHDHYTNSCATLALLGGFHSLSAAQTNVVSNTSSLFNGWTYYEILEKTIDRFSYNMGDFAYRGNWRYYSNNPPPHLEGWDGSAIQWPLIIMSSAEPAWGIVTPQWVRDNVWYAYTQIQNPTTGGVGYSSSTNSVNSAKTAGLIGAADWAGIPLTHTRVIDAMDYLGNNYLEEGGTSWGSDTGWTGYLYGMYAMKKGLQLTSKEIITVPVVGPRDWYDDFASYLLGDSGSLPANIQYPPSGSTTPPTPGSYAYGQRPDGSWVGAIWGSSPALGTPWGVLILTKGVLIPPPVAYIANVTPHPTNASILFDGSQSYHMDGNKAIVEWLWDWDASDGLDWGNPDATGQRATNPGYATTGTRTVTLRVRDNGAEPMYDTDTFAMEITAGNHAPVAVAIPAARLPNYSGAVGEDILLDGTESYDPDAGDAVASYAWDLDGDLAYDDATGATVVFSKTEPYMGQVGLRVTDGFGLDSANLAYADVIVVLNMDLSVESLEVLSFANNTVSVQASFANAPTSTQNAMNVLVRFYDNDPFSGNILGSGNVDLPIGSTDSLSATFAIPAGLQEVYVRLDADEQVFESDELNNITSAPIYLGKYSDSTFLIPGDPITYTLSFKNGSQLLATNVVINDPIPAELENPTIVGNSGASITATPGVTFAWTVEDLSPGDGGVITITGMINAGLGSDAGFTNTASIQFSLNGDVVNQPASLGLAVTKADSDGDGISDVDEGTGDSDGDTVPDYLDLDSDGDGIPDIDETGNGDLDADNDGVADDLTDSDGDGLADVFDPDQGGTPGSPPTDSDNDGTPDYLDMDSDDDGLLDVDETGNGALDTDDDGMLDDQTDTDGDGLADGVDPDDGGTPAVPGTDTDGDGTPDFQDTDDDGDGVPTATEDIDGDGDPTNDDSDGDTTPDYLDTDDDGDGIPSANEDADGDGDPSNDDTDGDGTPDYLDLDSDGDGLLDADECPGGPVCTDTDGDGTPDFQDTDDDGDGVSTEDEDLDGDGDPTNDDSDGDTTPDYLDDDDDDDGIPSADEGDGDTDGDGTPDYLDDDSDDDGIPDATEGDGDTDGDGTPDYQDDDDDDDGIPTADEDPDGDGNPSNDDSDGDGTPNYLDDDDDDDGIPTADEGDGDTDGDGTPDYLDDDSDDDGIPDATEGDGDTDGDGTPDYQDDDDDDDGIPTADEDIDGDGDPTNDDSDGDGTPDYQDVDDDGDGVPTADEDVGGDGDPTNDDSDGDSTPDYLDDDDDDDGIPTADEDADGNGDPSNDDTDGDGTPDYLDEDSDGDGLPDEDECPGGPVCDDTDGDGIPDFQDDDDDGDGIPTEDEDVDGDGDPSNDDSDDDGIPDYQDDDDDGDGVPTKDEGDGDSDNDGIPDYIDDDDDNDGIPTADEDYDGDGDPSNDDSDGDGVPDYLDDDDDNDGIPTAQECPSWPDCPDSNGDDIPDYLDPYTPGSVLSVSKSAMSTSGTANLPLSGVVTYTIVIHNDGDGVAIGTVMTDPLPSGVTFGSQSEGSAIVPPPGSALFPLPDNTYGWGPYDLAAHTAYTITFTVNVTTSADFYGTTIVNTAYVDAANSDPASDDASFTVVEEVFNTDVAVTKAFIGALGNITYTIVASNLGPGPADGTIVHDEVAAHIVDVAWTCVGTGGATCAASGTGNTINETLTSFPAGGVATFVVTARLEDIFADETNTVELIIPDNVIDSNMDNNSASVGRPFKVILPVILNGGDTSVSAFSRRAR